MLGRELILKVSAMPPVERLVRHGKPFRSVVSRFIAGDTLEDAMQKADELLAKGFLVSLDYLGENAKSKEESLKALSTYVGMLESIAKHNGYKGAAPSEYKKNHVENINISIKLTQCGLDQGDDFAEENFRQVLETAAKSENFVRADMEASAYTQRTIDMIKRATKDFANTGTVLQSYLYRTTQDVEWICESGLRCRMVKGAYLEPATVAHQDKAQVDEAYVTLSKKLIKEATYPAIATHDEKIIVALNEFVKTEGIDKSKFEYQMLYGIRRDLQESLLAEGYNVRVYIPFGDAWYPYFSRRLAERPANALFIIKAMFKP